MDQEKVYKNLEKLMVRYSDLKEVPVKDCDEELLPIVANSNLRISQIGEDMKNITGSDIYLRSGVIGKLNSASKKLRETNVDYALEVVYGYRALSIQRKLFEQQKEKFEKKFKGDELFEIVHNYIAVPEVSGHPTGGALDIQIIRAGEPINFGTKIWEFTKDSFVFSPFIDDEAKENRELLRRIMMEAGFAPFDGEWWHFSYGDKEWAKYYRKPYAIYDQREFNN